jgi:hypothetical protein
MERITKRMPTPEGVTAGGQALAKMPIGNAYHDLYIEYSGVTLEQLTEIRIKLNGKVVHRYSATERDAMNQFNGLAGADGILRIPFDRIGLKQRVGEELTLINTGSRAENGRAITSFHVEIDIAAAASAPVLELTAIQSDARPGGPGTVLHIVPFTRSAAGAGELQVSDLPYNSPTAQLLPRIYIKTANLTKMRIERDTYSIFERKKSLNELIQTQGNRVPQSGWFNYDTTERGYGGAMTALGGVDDFRLMMDMNGAEQVKIWPEYIGTLGD